MRYGCWVVRGGAGHCFRQLGRTACTDVPAWMSGAANRLVELSVQPDVKAGTASAKARAAAVSAVRWLLEEADGGRCDPVTDVQGSGAELLGGVELSGLEAVVVGAMRSYEGSDSERA